ncbi:hypothetical protein ACTWOF_000471 [Klebsiella michiganensis]
MNKSTITREQLEEWVAQFDEDGGCDATDRQLEALIRQSLAAMDSEPVGSISIDRLLQLLYQFDGANECAASIGDQEYALECGDVASALRELLSCRSALPVADVVAWSNPNEERKCDIRWRRHDVEPGPLYRHAQPAPVVPPEQHWEELCRQHPDMSIGDAITRAAWWNHCRAAMLERQLVDRVDEKSLTSINPAPDLVSLQKKAESIIGNYPGIPDGYVMVPVEPNGDMLAAAQDAYGETDGDIASTLRAAMLSGGKP